MATKQNYDLSPTDVFGLLANRRRRYALHYLTQREEAVAFDDLAAQLVQWEQDATSPSPENHLEQIVISLTHMHLPKLEEAGVLRYDRSEKRLELCESVTTLQPYLDQSADADLSYR